MGREANVGGHQRVQHTQVTVWHAQVLNQFVLVYLLTSATVGPSKSKIQAGKQSQKLAELR